MSGIFDLNRQDLWTPSGSLLELVVRGTVIYLGLVVLFRFLRRESSGLSIADVLLIVIIADAAQNGMAGEYRSIPEAFVLIGTIAGWSLLLDWLCYRSKLVRRLLQPPPLPLVRDGVVIRSNLRREFITLDELQSQLRLQGAVRIKDVQLCQLESDGQISVIIKSKSGPKSSPRQSRDASRSL